MTAENDVDLFSAVFLLIRVSLLKMRGLTCECEKLLTCRFFWCRQWLKIDGFIVI